MLISRRSFTQAAATALSAAMVPHTVRAAIQADTDRRALLLASVDPDLRGPLAHQADFSGTHLDLAVLPAARASIIPAPPFPTPPVVTHTIPGRGDAPPVKLFLINQGQPGERKPAILHTHGGGYVLMQAADALRDLQNLAREHDCVIVTVEHRLAPETIFPGALEDNYAGLLWLYQNADALGVDGSRIALLGESAGGGHAAMLAIAARDRREVPLVLQMLIYPMLDDRTGSTRMPRDPVGAIGWTPTQNRFGWSSFLGMPAGSPTVPYGSVPARVEDLRGLAPAFIGVGSIDLFVDEDIEYARRLIDAGVPTDLLVVPGAYHGFYGAVPQAPVSIRFVAAMNDALRRAFGRSASIQVPDPAA